MPQLNVCIALALSCSVVPAAGAQFESFTATRVRGYTQQGADLVESGYAWEADARLFGAGNGMTATLTSPGSASPIVMAVEFGTIFRTDRHEFLSELGREAAFPSGQYQFAYSGGPFPPGAFVADVQYPAFAPQPVFVMADGLATLQSVVPGMTTTVEVGGTTGGEFFFFWLFDGATQEFVNFGLVSDSGAASFELPGVYLNGGQPLLADHEYELRLVLATVSSQLVDVPIFPHRRDAAQSYLETSIRFTTVPSPAAVAPLAVLALLRRCRRG